MNRTDFPAPSLRSLLVDWFTLTQRTVRACATKADELLVDASETTRNTILDLGLDQDDGNQPEGVPGASLPPMDPDRFVAVMWNEVEEVLRQVAELINEDPNGCWAAVTEERVRALFDLLAQQALMQALDLRVTEAEAQLSRRDSRHATWVKKYRRLLAQEGRWPPTNPSSDHS